MKKIIVIATLVIFSCAVMAQQRTATPAAKPAATSAAKPAATSDAKPTATADAKPAASCSAKCTDGPKLVVKGAETVVIQTDAYSLKSNEIFKANLPYEKGIKEFKYDENNYKIAVAYDPKKTNPDEIRAAIAKLGFSADKVKANEQARAKLPAECRTMPKGCSKPCGKH